MKPYVQLSISGLAAVCICSHACLAQAQYPDGLYADVTTNKGSIVIQCGIPKSDKARYVLVNQEAVGYPGCRS